MYIDYPRLEKIIDNTVLVVVRLGILIFFYLHGDKAVYIYLLEEVSCIEFILYD